MKTLQAVWDLLNGKKMRLGAVLLLLAQILRALDQGEWSDVIDQIAVLLNGAGIGLVGVGAVHYGVKSK